MPTAIVECRDVVSAKDCVDRSQSVNADAIERNARAGATDIRGLIRRNGFNRKAIGHRQVLINVVDPEPEFFWSATVCNGDGYIFNGTGNISSEMNPEQNADGTYTVRFGCEGKPNNIPTVEGNPTGKFNVLTRHYGPSEMVTNDKDGYSMTKQIVVVQ